MSDETLFRVVFNGVTTGEFDPDTTQRKFQRLFRLDENKVRRIFAAREVILKDNIPEETAITYAIKLADIGCECYIEEVLSPDNVASRPDFVERRKGERRLSFRRIASFGTIVPDRRILQGRRKSDKADRTTLNIGLR